MRSNLDYFELIREGKRISQTIAGTHTKLALLSDAATQQFVPLLRALFQRHGVVVEIYEGLFDGIELDAFNPQSALHEFRPDVIAVLSAVQSLRTRFYGRPSDEQSWYDSELKKVLAIWEAVKENSGALILQSNFVLPLERFFGNFDHKAAPSFYSLVQRLNGRISEEAKTRSNVLINDVESLASWVGRKDWFDERLWNLAKTFCTLEYLPLVAQNVVDIVMATRGRGVKCVVLDLDNTLWGGVVGDEGPHGIQIAAHGDGESFYQFQCFLRELKRRGILLAVCSKNEHATAIRPFHENSEMVLKFDDMTAFVANWDNKAENLRRIQQMLNIGFDSIVFLDDNPFERNLVRQLLPEVIVPELPEDPSDYVKALSELNLFETTAFSAEDVQRADLYKQEARRKELEAVTGNFDDYLKSLEMRIEVARFTPLQTPRIAQLIQRSNQFNLTTHRYTQAQCDEMMSDEVKWIPLYAKLRDKFGDHGLISIVIAQPQLNKGAMQITDWIMSCRVLTRGVEEFLMNEIFTRAANLGLTSVRGTYVPTAKNGMVKEFFTRFGFQKISDEDGTTTWELAVRDYQPQSVYLNAEQPETEPSLSAV